ncbi:MAG: hypothetical protein ACRERR_01415 [Moraxellaceae bacterium]
MKIALSLPILVASCFSHAGEIEQILCTSQAKIQGQMMLERSNGVPLIDLLQRISSEKPDTPTKMPEHLQKKMVFSLMKQAIYVYEIPMQDPSNFSDEALIQCLKAQK